MGVDMTQALYTTVMDPHEGQLRLHGPAAFEAMRKAGRLAAEVLDHLTPHVLPEVATIDLDTMAWEFVRAAGAASATVFYRGFSHSLCTSVNHVVCTAFLGRRS